MRASSRSSSIVRGPAGFDALQPLLAGCCSFTSAEGRAFTQIPVGSNGGLRSVPVRSRIFREWFFGQCYAAHQIIPTSRAFAAILHYLESQASLNPSQMGIRVPRRIDSRSPSGTIQSILIDLANSDGQIVEISASGWSTASRTGAPFETSCPNLSLPNPESASAAPADPELPADPLQFLRASLNLGPADGPDWIRCFAWLLNALRPDAPYPILVLRGPSGCGKSLAARVLRTMVDPSSSPVTPLPGSPRRLLELASDNWILAFDHISTLSPRISSALCRIATGAGLAFREPGHTGSVQLWIRRPILLTAAADLSLPPDIAARSLIVDLPALASGSRPEREILQPLERCFPRILGALCDAVSATLAHAGRDLPPHATRHAAALAWALAAAPIVHCTDDQVLRAFDSVPVVKPADPLVQKIRGLVQGGSEWIGTATDLARALSCQCVPKVLSSRLRTAGPALAEAGVDLSCERRHGGVRVMRLRASPGSALSLQPAAGRELTPVP